MFDLADIEHILENKLDIGIFEFSTAEDFPGFARELLGSTAFFIQDHRYL